MTKFEDGPAEGHTLMLKRAPLFLRVTHVPQKISAPWDALDQTDDTPELYETLYAYERVGEAGSCHLSCRGRGRSGKSGFWAVATYRFVADQPSDAVMRRTIAWREWCLGRVVA